MFIGCRFACSRAGPMCRLRHGRGHITRRCISEIPRTNGQLPATIFSRLERKSVDLRRHSLSSNPRERGCCFTRSCQGNRLGILDLVENPGAGKRPVVSPSIQGEIPALIGQESRGKSRHVPLGKKHKSCLAMITWDWHSVSTHL